MSPRFSAPVPPIPSLNPLLSTPPPPPPRPSQKMACLFELRKRALFGRRSNYSTSYLSIPLSTTRLFPVPRNYARHSDQLPAKRGEMTLQRTCTWTTAGFVNTDVSKWKTGYDEFLQPDSIPISRGCGQTPVPSLPPIVQRNVAEQVLGVGAEQTLHFGCYCNSAPLWAGKNQSTCQEPVQSFRETTAQRTGDGLGKSVRALCAISFHPSRSVAVEPCFHNLRVWNIAKIYRRLVTIAYVIKLYETALLIIY